MLKPSVYLVSLGCAKNLVDSEVIVGNLLKAQFSIAPSPAEAEIIIINTCSFIKAAKEEAIETILNLSHYKQSGACNLLMVTGCLPQRYGRSLANLFPEVDVFIGTGEFFRIEEIIKSQKETRISPQFYIGKSRYLYDDATPRVNTSLPGSAYIKIAEGCSHRCSFCIVPKIRGPFRSRHPDSVYREALNLSTQGIKEINLVAQDTTRYGKDLSPKADLPLLLRTLARIEGIEWIRVLYANPQGITEELLQVLREEKKICKYLDIPLQHINPEILKAMNRKHSPQYIHNLIAKIWGDLPRITIRTTLMVGFPGETEAQFKELVDFVRQIKFEHLGVFAYSHEEGTLATQLTPQIPEKIKEERRKIIMSLQAEISREKNRKLLNTVQRVLIEKKEGSGGIGRTAAQAPEVDGLTRVAAKSPLIPGKIYNTLITEAGVYDLKGVISLPRSSSKNL